MALQNDNGVLPVRHQTKAQLALRALREAIQRGDVRPGERLVMTKVAKQLGMSPTPVREAIQKLEAEGLISYQPHQSVSVVDLSLQDVEEIHLLRGVLEGLATKLAVPRLSDDDVARLRELAAEVEDAHAGHRNEDITRANANWHLYIYRASGARRLQEFLFQLWAIFPWDTIWVIPGRAADSVREHAALMEAIEARDAERASQLMQEHILNNQRSALAYLAEHGVS